MKNQNFIVSRTSNGILIKRYFRYKKDEHGLTKREFYYSERMNLPEQLLYRFTNYYSRPAASRKKQRKMSNATKLVIATLVAGSILAGGGYAISEAFDGDLANIPAKNGNEITEHGSMPSQKVKYEELGYVVPAVPPTPVTYIDNGIEFVSLDSLIEVSKYNHAQLVKELEAYNASVPDEKKLEFDTKLFDAEFFVAVAVQENSLMTKSQNNPDHKGCYQISAAAFKEAKKIAEKLGTEMPENLSDLENPMLGNKAAMYIYIQNYNAYLKDSMRQQNYTREEEKAALTTAYLFGGPGTSERVDAGESVDSIYHTKIDLFADIVREYSHKLYYQRLLKPENTEKRATERRKTFNKLYQVTNEKAAEILAEKNEQIEQEQ